MLRTSENFALVGFSISYFNSCYFRLDEITHFFTIRVNYSWCEGVFASCVSLLTEVYRAQCLADAMVTGFVQIYVEIPLKIKMRKKKKCLSQSLRCFHQCTKWPLEMFRARSRMIWIVSAFTTKVSHETSKRFGDQYWRSPFTKLVTLRKASILVKYGVQKQL